jgi:DNA-binding CsgD family transcriptional regulator
MTNTIRQRSFRSRLTKKESQLVEALADNGLSPREIGEKLKIKPRAIRNFMRDKGYRLVFF